MNVLAIDVGGTHIKILVTGQKVHRQFVSSPQLNPGVMVAGVKNLVQDWPYDVISIGYPGPVRNNRPVAEPFNLGKGWVEFNYRAAFNSTLLKYFLPSPAHYSIVLVSLASPGRGQADAT
jgi:polyphosphate glucokinase